MLKSTTFLLRTRNTLLRHKIDNNCDKTKEVSKEASTKGSTTCEALRDNLLATDSRNAKQEQAIDLLKHELANLKVNAPKKCETMRKW